MEMAIISTSLLVSAFLFSLFQAPTFAIEKSYVVYLGSHSHGKRAIQADIDRVKESHYDLLGSFLESKDKAKEKIFYSYTQNINGFAAIIDEEKAAELAEHPDVVSVFPNTARQLHTTRSWDFLGLESNGSVPESSLWKRARFGEDVIIATLDTGVWPESKSFNDEGYGPVPSRWKGICQKGRKDGIKCNRKLIGVRHFSSGYESIIPLNETERTARDIDGHGTHTLSTAGGDYIRGANVFHHGYGTSKGGSPKARVAAYKVCWPTILFVGSCFEADIMAAFDAAISDGVDVLSLSLGGSPSEFYKDSIAIGAYHAVQKGIVVVASAGNSGPVAGTVSNVAPWIITVGASTLDRQFTTTVALGDRAHLKGESLSEKGLPAEKFYPLISGEAARTANATASSALLCIQGSLDPKKVRGKILACLRGENGRMEKGAQAKLAGAVGMILANDEVNGEATLADPHVLPAAHVGYTDGKALFAYINSTKTPFAFITSVKTELGIKPNPVMASFSSRGPNTVEPTVLKPDITAPGVSVIASYSLAETADEVLGQRKSPFNMLSGTSMSCPHISGIVGLLKTLHPEWSPAAIRSAIVTTARTRANDGKPLLDSPGNKSTPFAYGGGHVHPNSAMDPGLVYDLSTSDYLNFLCARGYDKKQLRLFSNKTYTCPKSVSLADFNYPSITVPKLNGSITVTRTVKNVGPPGKYTARVRTPSGVRVSVQPTSLKFDKKGEVKTFKVTLKAVRKAKSLVYVFGALIWTDGKRYVRSPIVVKQV